MKKLSLILLASVFTLSIYSCRETTEERTEDSLQEVGTDLETTTTTEETYRTEEEAVYSEETQGTEGTTTTNEVQ